MAADVEFECLCYLTQEVACSEYFVESGWEDWTVFELSLLQPPDHWQPGRSAVTLNRS